MGDFLLDLRASEERAPGKAAEFLKFYPDMRVDRLEYPEFTLLVSSADNAQTWGPYSAPDGSLFAALCGRIALDQIQWDEAAKMEGPGGLASKFICKSYVQGGVAAIEGLSGNFVILLFDRLALKLFVVTDRWGLFPAFKLHAGAARLVYASHPDALADAVGESRNWDLTSFAEFILTGKLSAPFTYYRNIKALPVASTTTLSFTRSREVAEQTRQYFQFEFRPHPERKLDELAEQFAAAFRKAVAKRTLPVLGRSAVALSGGLDSRTVLCSAPNRQALTTFTCYDVENREFRIAQSIAREAGVEFVPLKRGFDYYGDQAASGVRISAGMGCIASNHFLGFRDKLRELGADNLLTGCYCDYLFKGLALNKRVNKWTTTESLDSFDFSYYFGHFNSNTNLGAAVRRRLEDIFPSELHRYDSESAVLAVERRRMFPLCYEEDNAERTIPQRTMGWYVPIAENDLMEIILNMSCSMKLNRRLFARMVEKVCGGTLSHIPDANTGAPVNASALREALHVHLGRVEALYRKLLPSNATGGSWLNWNFYANQSRVIQDLWSSPCPAAREVFEMVLGKDGFQPDIRAYEGRRIYLFLQLFTLKLWFDQRPQ
jgi:asparagine synthase (glutamine-hydrolysing)